jgi:RNA 2',3'-cyclic 3'-phosphodiesterase
MKRKIFISINLPDRDKKRLIRATEKWQDLPVKWVKEPNLHISVVFLGHVADESMAEICEKVCGAVKNTEIFDLEFERMELGPDAENPKMIWLSGEASETLRILHEKIEKALGIYISSRKFFRPHITLGRIRGRKWEALESKPEISEKYNLIVSVESVDIMASDFGDGSREYTTIQACPLS